MSELIDRQAAIDALDRIGSLDTEADKKYAISVFEELPSAQPEIIRCKDCKHWDGVDTCDVIDAPVWDDDFCSMAERRIDG